MSSGPETRYIAGIHKQLPPALYRMKNHNVYNGGIADCWYSGGRDLWVEYKWLELPKRDDTIVDLVSGKKPTLAALQQNWIQSRVEEGRDVWVIVGHKDGGVVFKQPWEWRRTALTAGHYRSLTLLKTEIIREIVAFVQG